MSEITDDALNRNFDLEEKFYNDLITDKLNDFRLDQVEKIDVQNYSVEKRIKIQSILAEKELSNMALELYYNMPEGNFLYSERKMVLNTLYEYGRIKDFFSKAKLTAEYLLSQKLYFCLGDFLENYEEILGKRFDFKLISFLFFLETKNLKKIEEFIKTELRIFYIKQRNLNELERYFEILVQYGFDSFQLNYLKLKLKHILAVGGKYEVLPKETVDFLLHSEDYNELLLVANLVAEDKREILKPILLKSKPKSIENLFYSKLYSDVFRLKSIKSEIKEEKSSDIDSIIKKEDLIVIEKNNKNAGIDQKIYKQSAQETNIIKSFSCDDELKITQDFVLSFLFTEQYAVADYLFQRLDCTLMVYERAFVKYKLNNYSECIYLLNTYINKNAKEDSLESLFYLKALAFEAQGNGTSALNAFREVNKRNPNFKQVKRKILMYEKRK